ncbi:hypothetical protein ABIA03_000321 [Bradyrhizobium yuanmingense]|uniref:Uncharacterized protein n=1 Tax=Bradyrhizobium yuanmingense TaxID=108015 RepID=A0ABV4G9Z1_9BRAD
MLPYPIRLKSASIGCPFHDTSAITIPKPGSTPSMPIVRFARARCDARGQVFLHRSCALLERPIRSTDADGGRLDLWPNECESSVTSAPGRSVIATSGGTALRLRFGPVWVTHSVRTCQPSAPGLAANLRSHRPRCSGRGRCCPHRRSQHRCSRRRIYGHAKFVGMVFVDLAGGGELRLASAAPSDPLRGIRGLQPASSGQSDLVARPRDRAM